MAGLFGGSPPPPPPRLDQSSPVPISPVPSGIDDASADDGTVTPSADHRERPISVPDTDVDATHPKITGRLASILGSDDGSLDDRFGVGNALDGRPLPLPPKPRPDKPQTISDAGLQFIRSREVDPNTRGPVLIPRGDGANNPTIGYGHKLRKGELFEKGIDEETAERIFRSDVAEAERAVRRQVTVPLTQGQYDALVSLVYNWGSGNLAGSSLLKLLNAGDYEAAGKEIPKLLYSTDTKTKEKKFMPGYVSRREGEYGMFLGNSER